MVFDAGQVVLGQSTRALGDSWGTTLRFFVAFWCVMIPVSLVLAFRTPLAEAGLFIGTAVGCARRGAAARPPLPHAARAGALMASARRPRLSYLAWLPQAALLGDRPRAALRARAWRFAAGFARPAGRCWSRTCARRVDGNLRLIFPGRCRAAERRRIRAGMATASAAR